MPDDGSCFFLSLCVLHESVFWLIISLHLFILFCHLAALIGAELQSQPDVLFISKMVILTFEKKELTRRADMS